MLGPIFSDTFIYDGVSRPLTRTISAESLYQFDYTYNTLGQLDTLTYPTSTASVRFKVKYGYTSGYLSSVQEYTGNTAHGPRAGVRSAGPPRVRYGLGRRGGSVGPAKTRRGSSAYSHRTGLSVVLKIRVSMVRFRPWPPFPTL